MARSAQSASLASVPGYRQLPTFQPSFPAMPAPPQLPQVPQIDDARAPGATERSLLQSTLTNLPAKYAGQFTAAQANAKSGLAGYGGWTWGKDNPATPEREDLLVGFNPNAKPGEREKQAIQGERSKANERGALYSSQANQSIGAALQKQSLETQAVVTQYAGQIASLISQQAAETGNIVQEWTRLFGEDSRWLAENPMPAPPAPVVAPPAPPPPEPVAPTPPEPVSPYTIWGRPAPWTKPKPKPKLRLPGGPDRPR